ncbi:mechanosensitive ion channel family protein [Merismopedia glauca]|uniref:Mechanosensitive ion channel protein MscS n=1 Tax=Merismopedia glauca CCAP 1448/3 TaxID=1296344 RepID=A0A2T1C151_9CYAN|nr:mechanosensitive ion channel domain-containing protein [Merismopedia glauca]PSB01972.1 mechanosensitive ion channel protein MscS [Merismopedia glauca CCAP 1448/3]
MGKSEPQKHFGVEKRLKSEIKVFPQAIAKSRRIKLAVGGCLVPLLLGAATENAVTSTDLFLGIGAIVAAVILHLLLDWVWKIARGRLEQLLTGSTDRNRQNQPQTLDLLLNLSLLSVRTTLWVLVGLYLANILPVSRGWSHKIAFALSSSLTSPVFSLGKSGYSVLNILFLGLTILGLTILAGIVTNLLRMRVLSVLAIGRGAQEAIATIAKYTFITLGTVVILQIWGLDLTSLTIVASALGVGVGFGLQDIAKNFGSGLVLMFERPIQVGDFVEVGKYAGTVERIGSRSTLIRTVDRVSIIVPNSRFLETEIVNWSHESAISRIHLPVGVAYDSDVSVVKTALLEAVEGCSDVLLNPVPQVRLKGFRDDAIDFELLVWTNQPSKQSALKSDLYFEIEAAFKRSEIQVPFPQQDLHVSSGSLPIEVSPQLEEILLNLSKLVTTKKF